MEEELPGRDIGFLVGIGADFVEVLVVVVLGIFLNFPEFVNAVLVHIFVDGVPEDWFNEVWFVAAFNDLPVELHDGVSELFRVGVQEPKTVDGPKDQSLYDSGRVTRCQVNVKL